MAGKGSHNNRNLSSQDCRGTSGQELSPEENRRLCRREKIVFLAGVLIGFVFDKVTYLFDSPLSFTNYSTFDVKTSLRDKRLKVLSTATNSSRNGEENLNDPMDPTSTPQVFNFIKELQCRDGHMDVPPLLKLPGQNKVVVDIGLDAGDEFFASLESGYSVYGFEANPITVQTLRRRCENEQKRFKCVYVNAANITQPLPPIHRGGYLIEGGAGSVKTEMNMSLAGPGSSFVEDSPTKKNPGHSMVTILPVSDVVDTDVFFFKLDVQGFEFEVLKGAQRLFRNRIVKSLLVEVYPRGLKNAGVDFLEFINFIWYDLGMFCSTSLPEKVSSSFKKDHPNSIADFALYLKELANDPIVESWWGKFDDFYCFNRNKKWN